MKTVRAYRDLPDEDKKKVIVGFVLVFTFFPLLFIFTDVVFPRSYIDSLYASGMSVFGVAKTILPTMYLFFSLPVAISASIAVAYLNKRLSSLLGGFLILGFAGAFFFLAYLFLSLFDAVLGSLSVALQTPFLALSFLVPMVLLILLVKRREVNRYMKKSFG